MELEIIIGVNKPPNISVSSHIWNFHICVHMQKEFMSARKILPLKEFRFPRFLIDFLGWFPRLRDFGDA